MNPAEVDGVIENPVISYGVPGFDHFGQALLTTFQVCTLEGWSNLMYTYVETSRFPVVPFIFFPLLVAIGSFFTMNLILAQIIDSYSSQQAKFIK